MIKSIISDGLPIVAVLCCSSKSAYMMSKTQRSATHPAMAKWLVSAARHAIWS